MAQVVVQDIEVIPLDTYVDEYVLVEVKLIEYSTCYYYSKSGSDTEVFAGEGVGLL